MATPLKHLTLALLHAGDDIDIHSIVEELTAHTLGAEAPGRSISMWARRARFSGVDSTLVSKIEAMVKGNIAAARRARRAPPPFLDSWLNLEEAAALLRMSPRTLEHQLREVTFRHMYGWPWWNGDSWFFAARALAPTTRIAFLGDQPEVEPHRLLPASFLNGAKCG